MLRIQKNGSRLIFAAGVFLLLAVTSSLFGGKGGNGPGKPGGDDDGSSDTNFAFVFEHLDNGLFLTTIDDGNRVQLTSPKGRVRHAVPTWSPDLDPETPGYQGMIAYLEISDSSKDLYVINPDGTGNRLVRSGIGWFEVNEAETLAWTPNGQEIVFVTNRARINAIEVSTGDMRVLLDYSNDIPQVTRAPVISSQGMLAFVRDQVYLAQLTFDEFGLVEVDETSIVNLPPVGFPRGFSPDGSYLAFNGWNDATGWEVGVLDLVTLEETVVFQGGNDVSRVSWSPDGSQIATHGPTPGSPSWSQDLCRITNWNDSPNRQVIRVTNTDGFKNHEISVSWNPGWIEL